MPDDLREERGRVAELGRAMLDRGLTVGTGGNLSARSGDRLAVSPSGVPYGEITPDSVPVVDLAGGRVAGDLAPSSEMPMHAAIYRNREDVGGIVHSHSPYASTFASLGEAIPPSHYLVAVVGREIPVADYAPPGTEELGDLAVAALGEDHDACLLAHHGVIAVGGTLDAAFEAALAVEFVARIHYQASLLGEPARLDEAELDDLREVFRSYGRR